ncbi:hypothetical protein PIB30_041476 [Stylosanthes scabra]|uniref:DUF4283 domain-containing protein n=1 Tax=Stylosanthes scabra TaxID=79078 RepID=A0ABU6RF20_9FABA|nr:hypothetical protein [Stylosanthes scabra]
MSSHLMFQTRFLPKVSPTIFAPHGDPTEMKFKTIKEALMGIWGRPKGVLISYVGVNEVLISFQNSNKVFSLWRGSPRNIGGCLVNMHPWTGRKSAMEVEHKYLEVWIQIHGVPLDFMNWRTVETVGSRLGRVLEMENTYKDKILQRTVLRVKVQLDVNKPLRTSC